MMGVWRLSLSSVAPCKRCLNPSISSSRLQSRPNSHLLNGSELNQAPRLFSSLTAPNASSKLRNSIFSSKRFDSTAADAAKEAKPIWHRNPKDVTKVEYNEFFRNTFKQDLDPLAYSHFVAEGVVEFSSILFVPTKVPKENTSGKDICQGAPISHGEHLSAQGLPINKDLLPIYLSFVKAVVDSAHLNVTREILQGGRNACIIRKQLVRKVFDMILGISLRENRDDYVRFWENFGQFLKLGCIEDKPNHNRIAPLLRFFSSRSKDGLISLDEYVENMKPKQKYIYYIAAESIMSAENALFGEKLVQRDDEVIVSHDAMDKAFLHNLKNAPFLEKLLQKDYEVLFLVEPMEEAVIQNLKNYKEKKFLNIAREDLDLGDENMKESKVKQEFGPTCDWIKKRLGDKVASVQISNRLTTSACVLVCEKSRFSTNVERLIKDDKLLVVSPYDMDAVRGRKAFEINPEHQIIRGLRVSFQTNPDNSVALNAIDLLYDMALLSSGFNPWNLAETRGKIYEMMSAALSGKHTASSSNVLCHRISH